MLNVLLFIISMFSIQQALATKFKGYSGNYKTKSLTLNESVERFVETEKEFLILLSRHAAFYRFPKTAEYSMDVRTYLNKLIKSKKRINFEIDPVSTEIKFIKE